MAAKDKEAFSKPVLTIRNLVDQKDSIPIITRWFWDEWQDTFHAFGIHSQPELERWYETNCTSADKIPLQLVALEGKEIVGSGGLDRQDMTEGKYKDVGPWMVSIFVPEKHRRKGIAGQIIRALLAEAGRLKLPELWLWSEKIADYYAGFGWKTVEKVDYLKRSVTVMRMPLQPTQAAAAKSAGVGAGAKADQASSDKSAGAAAPTRAP